MSFQPIEDRLLLRIGTRDGAELRFHLTRRYTRLLLDLLDRAGTASPEARLATTAEAREAIASFQREEALGRADFSQPFRAAGGAHPLGEAPVLLSRARLELRPDGVHHLALHPESGSGIDLAVDARLAHALRHLVARALEPADWGLAPSTAERAAQASAPPPSIN